MSGQSWASIRFKFFSDLWENIIQAIMNLDFEHFGFLHRWKMKWDRPEKVPLTPYMQTEKKPCCVFETKQEFRKDSETKNKQKSQILKMS